MNDSHWADRPDLVPASRRTAVWPWVLLAIVLLAVVGIRMAIVPGGARGQGVTHPAVGTQLQVIDLKPLTGAGPPVAPADLSGKVTLINFWGPWCGPCGVEFPHLVEIEQHFRGEPDFRLLSISYPGRPEDDSTLAADATQFLTQKRASFPTYFDPQGLTASHLVQAAKLRGFVFPTTVVVGREGSILALWTGYRAGDERQVRQVVDQALRSASRNP